MLFDWWGRGGLFADLSPRAFNEDDRANSEDFPVPVSEPLRDEVPGSDDCMASLLDVGDLEGRLSALFFSAWGLLTVALIVSLLVKGLAG